VSSDAESLEGRPDTPRSTYSLFSQRVTLVVVGVLVGLAAVAWWSTVRQASSMSDMVSGLGQVGARAPNDMTIPIFLGMWVAMMVAMMFPTVAPIVLAHRMVVQRRGEGNVPTAAFVLGYILVWILIGAIPLVGFLGFRNLAADAGDSRWLPTLAGGILIVAGAYQFTRWKATCLKACRSPMTFLMTHDFGGGSRSAFKAGVTHGAYCLGCCWALMAVLVVVGLMNLVWMAGIALVFLAEKNWKHAVGLTKVVGSALIALGIAVIVAPGILPEVSGAGEIMDRMGDRMKM
jgi:predicted metal-binding membrane protein